MNLILLVPKVAQNYIARFPESTNNAYKYFNYDHRVVEERVDRGDVQSTYKGPEALTNEDYDSIVVCAKQIIDPVLFKYSPKVAYEDALHLAIRHLGKGRYDGKINASKYNVLLDCLLKGQQKQAQFTQVEYGQPKTEAEAKKKTEKAQPEKTKVIPHHVLKQLGLKKQDIPRQKTKPMPKGVPYLTRTDKGIVVKE